MAQLPCIGLSCPLSKQPFGSCAIYFHYYYCVDHLKSLSKWYLSLRYCKLNSSISRGWKRSDIFFQETTFPNKKGGILTMKCGMSLIKSFSLNQSIPGCALAPKPPAMRMSCCLSIWRNAESYRNMLHGALDGCWWIGTVVDPSKRPKAPFRKGYLICFLI